MRRVLLAVLVVLGFASVSQAQWGYPPPYYQQPYYYPQPYGYYRMNYYGHQFSFPLPPPRANYYHYRYWGR